MQKKNIMCHYQWQGEALLLRCQLQPRSSKNEIVGLHDGKLKICVTAPPVDGKANKHLIATVAKWFGTAKSHVSIVKGETGRQKTLRVDAPTQLPPEACIEAHPASR
jgi:uncharacterized protein (TIGR00251 family)